MKNGQFMDQVLWSILAEDWKQQKSALTSSRVH